MRKQARRIRITSPPSGGVNWVEERLRYRGVEAIEIDRGAGAAIICGEGHLPEARRK